MLGEQVPVLGDGVVTLRALHDGHLAELLEMWRDPEMVAWTYVPSPSTPDHVRRFVREQVPQAWASGEAWIFAVEATAPDGRVRLVGTVGLRRTEPGRAEAFWGSHPRARGRGWVRRAVRLLLAWGYDGPALEATGWTALVGNWDSRRLAWHVGFRHEGTVRRGHAQRGVLRDVWTATHLRGEPMEPASEWLVAPVLHGDGVVLRPPRVEDAERVREACADPATSYWLGQLPSPYSLDDARHHLEVTVREDAATARGLHWVLADPRDDRLLGTVALVRWARPTSEVGYWTHPEGRGRGLTSEAVRVVAAHALAPTGAGGLGLERLTGWAAVDNAASRRVLERAGFAPCGVLRGAAVVRDGAHDLAGYDRLA